VERAGVQSKKVRVPQGTSRRLRETLSDYYMDRSGRVEEGKGGKLQGGGGEVKKATGKQKLSPRYWSSGNQGSGGEENDAQPLVHRGAGQTNPSYASMPRRRAERGSKKGHCLGKTRKRGTPPGTEKGKKMKARQKRGTWLVIRHSARRCKRDLRKPTGKTKAT